MKKPLLVFLIPSTTDKNELQKHLVDGNLDEFSYVLAARLSTVETIKQDVLDAIASGEMVAGIIIEAGYGKFNWECNIPIQVHPEEMADWFDWLKYSIANLVLYYGKNMLKGMQVLNDKN